MSYSGVEVDEYGLTYGVQDRKPIFLPITCMGKERSYIKKKKIQENFLYLFLMLSYCSSKFSKEDPVSFLRSSPPPTPQGITCICSTCVIVTGNCLTYIENKTNDK